MNCQNKFINCLPREDCFILCDDNKSCIDSVINCPINGDCIIECHGIQSCQHTTIDATLSHGNLDIECDGNDISCKGLKIYGSTLHDNIGNFNLICNGNTQSCIESHILCPSNGNCNILCDSDTSCKNSLIIGPNTGDLHIECNNIKSCLNSTFDASKSNTLNIKGCIESESCLDISLYCPPHTTNKNCFLEGNDNLGTYNTIQPTQISNKLETKGYIDEDMYNYKNTFTLHSDIHIGQGIIIYAKYGWMDIDIKYKGSFGIIHVGKMICGENYDMECDIAPNKWACIQQNAFCNNVFLDMNLNIAHINTTHNGSDESDLLGIDLIGIQKDGPNENNKQFFNVKLIIVFIAFLLLLFCCLCIGYVQSRHTHWDHVEGEGENILRHELDNKYEI